VDIAIGEIDGRAVEQAIALELCPLIRSEYLESRLRHASLLTAWRQRATLIPMDMDELLPRRADDPLVLLVKQDLDSLSVDELKARIAVLESEIQRVRNKIEGAVNHLASAEALFKH
jgi:uncharacterized small protein (DUF1192 family)